MASNNVNPPKDPSTTVRNYANVTKIQTKMTKKQATLLDVLVDAPMKSILSHSAK